MNLKGEPAHVGRHCGGSTYRVTREMVDFYAEALGDPSPLHARWAPPLLFHSECFRFLGEWYLKNLFGNLHARQDWELFAPVPVGAEVRTRSTLVERYTKRSRNYVVNETDLTDAEGRLLVRGRTHQSFLPEDRGGREDRGGGDARGDGAGGPGARRAGGEPSGFVVDAATAKEKARRQADRPPFPTATGPELEASRITVDRRRCWMFSGPGANYHTDREQARKLGFPDIVVQGMMTTCFVSGVLQRHFGMGWLRGGKMSVKLTNVLWADEAVTTRARIREQVPEGARTRVYCDVWAEKDDGTRVLLGEASALEGPDPAEAGG